MDDTERLKLEYARRAQDPRYREWYSRTNAANRFIEQDRDAAVQSLLAGFRLTPPPHAHILDVGCGAGRELAKWREIVPEARLCGLELLPERVQNGRVQFPRLPLLNGDAAALPIASETFDLVVQFTVFSSILDDGLRERIAAEMLRVLKPDGVILWYDYWFNPTNPQTRGVTLHEVRRLFPGCAIHSRRVTLAPPLARWLAPRSLKICAWLNRIPALRSHYLILIRRIKPLPTR